MYLNITLFLLAPSLFLIYATRNHVAKVRLLQVGDEILSVNGNLFGHLTHDEAVSVLKSSHRLCFLVRYIGKVPHSSLLPKNQRATNSQTHHESQGNF